MMVYVISKRPQVCGLTFAFNVSIQTCRFLSCRPTPDNWFTVFLQPVFFPILTRSEGTFSKITVKPSKPINCFLMVQRYDEILQRANFSAKFLVFRCNFLCFVPILLSRSLQNWYVCRENIANHVCGHAPGRTM